MTSFIQPLDASIIWCFKAHYRHAFCMHAIKLDETGDDDIYKINLLEVMQMVKEAWASDHAFKLSITANLMTDPNAWKIVLDFAARNITEDDNSAALVAVKALKKKAIKSACKPLKMIAVTHLPLPELKQTESELITQTLTLIWTSMHSKGKLESSVVI
ncbi:hypothetical protein BS17DRAFT_794588 [Gyrodon lividus]|nr:hypothetical protein BS17DRAFT_794588 [Gyrodon lividus]